MQPPRARTRRHSLPQLRPPTRWCRTLRHVRDGNQQDDLGFTSKRGRVMTAPSAIRSVDADVRFLMLHPQPRLRRIRDPHPTLVVHDQHCVGFTDLVRRVAVEALIDIARDDHLELHGSDANRSAIASPTIPATPKSGCSRSVRFLGPRKIVRIAIAKSIKSLLT